MGAIEDRLEKIERNQTETLNIITELKMGVCGSEKIGVEGLIQKVDRHEKYIETDKKQKWMIAGGLGILTFLARFLKL